MVLNLPQSSVGQIQSRNLLPKQQNATDAYNPKIRNFELDFVFSFFSVDRLSSPNVSSSLDSGLGSGKLFHLWTGQEEDDAKGVTLTMLGAALRDDALPQGVATQPLLSGWASFFIIIRLKIKIIIGERSAILVFIPMKGF